MGMRDLYVKLPYLYRRPIAIIAVSVSYYLAALFGLSLSFKPDYIAALWPPNAVLLAVLLITKRKDWIWFLLAAIPAELLADLPSGIPLVMALGFIGADWIEVLVGAILIRAITDSPIEFNTLKQTANFIICSVLIAPFIAAWPGAFVTGIGVTEPGYLTRWFRWFISEALTHMLITPFILLWLAWNVKKTTQRKTSFYIELLWLTSAIVILSLAVFSGKWLPTGKLHSIMYTPLPLLLWASVRFGTKGIFTSAVFVAITSISLASNGYGPFSHDSIPLNVLNLQAFLIITLLPLIFLSSLVEEQKISAKNIKDSEVKYRTLFQSSTDALSIIDAGTGQFIDCNDAAVKLHDTGTRNNFLGLSPDMLSPEYQPDGTTSKQAATQHIQKAVQDGSNVFEWLHIKKDGTPFPTLVTLSAMKINDKDYVLAVGRDLTAIRAAEANKEKLIDELQTALNEVKTLSGFIPICASCKKIRDDEGYWQQVEEYIKDRSDAEFSHSLCPDCIEKLYPDFISKKTQ